MKPKERDRGAGRPGGLVHPAALRTRPGRDRPGFGRERVLAALLSTLLLPPGIAAAVNGGVDVRNTNQSGLTGDQSFTTSLRRENVYLTQRVPFHRRMFLEVDARWLRDVTGSSFDQVDRSQERRTLQGSLALDYSSKPWSMGVRGLRFDQRSSGDAALSSDYVRDDLEAWLRARPATRLRLTGNLSRTSAGRERTVGEDVETREVSSALSTEYRSAVGEFEYRFTGLSFDAMNRNIHQTQASHRLDYRGTTRFAAERADVSVRMQSTFFNQSTETGETGGGFLLLPLSGGVLLDDTPETVDPLEGEPDEVPELFDRDRETPTTIDLGDDAPAVREFGGDYRNIQLDFGESRDLASAVLYVDRRLSHPELFRWRLFVTDDPDGRIWTELGPDRAAVTYREWETGLQGWEVAFPGGPPSGRFFKMVDVKLGTTAPELSVTELEVYAPAGDGGERAESRSEDYRLDGRFGYDVTSTVRVQLTTRIRERIAVGEEADVSERNHGILGRWSPGDYLLTARYSVHRITGDARSDSDVSQYQASASRGIGSSLSTTLAWNRSEDRGSGRISDTNTASLIATWRAAAGLRFSQLVSYGTQDDRVREIRSRSVALITNVRSTPVPSLGVDFDRSDRWVDTEGGVEFRNFNDTGLTVTWNPVPLISVSSNVRYLVRETDEWTVRNLGSWSPLRGGRLEILLSGHTFYDSRTDDTERGGSVTARWRVRPGLLVDAGVSVQRLESAGAADEPVSTTLHAVWTF